jgi:hypothetical protein
VKLLATLLANGRLARLVAAWSSVSLGTWAFAILLSLNLLGDRGAIVVVGLALPVLGVALWRRVAGFAAGAAVPERAFALVRGLPLFAPLPWRRWRPSRCGWTSATTRPGT